MIRMGKRITRSSAVKLIAFVLCVASVCAAVYILFSSRIDMFLRETVYAEGMEACLYRDGAARLALDALEAQTRGETERVQELKSILERNYRVEYYASYGAAAVTNSYSSDEEYFWRGQSYITVSGEGDDRHIESNAGGYRLRTMESELDGYKLCVRLNDDYVNEKQQELSAARGDLEKSLRVVYVFLGAAVICFLYLAWFTGIAEDDKIRLILIDRLYVEIKLALIAASTIIVIAIIDEYFDLVNGIDGMYIQFITMVTAAAGSVMLALVLSLIRNLKSKTFLERSLIFKCLKLIKRVWLWFWRGIFGFFREIKNGILRMFAKNFSGRRLILVILAYTLAVMFCMVIILAVPPLGLLFMLALAVGTCIFAVRRVDGFTKIKNGLRMTRLGRLDTKIADCPPGVLGDMAEDINKISEGLAQAVDEQVRAERMKSELITNVSHDLKTPLTSIINYAKLLAEQNLSPEEANDYVAIIQQKSERLKKLTSDLFDVSKVQSGNEEINFERLDAVLLLKQSLAEQNDAVEASSIEIITSYPEDEVFITADGKKLSRVFENLIVNILKYSLNNTRAYVQIKSENREVRIEFKNIANYQMNFNDEEITERFVRGDVSRSTDGSGLGLAIAQSYIRACGGDLKIVTDGDLFKAVITFSETE